MKCNSPINPLTGEAVVGIEREQALRDPDAPRCSQQLSPEDVFCPACGAKVERSNSGNATAKKDVPIAKIIGIVVGVCIGVVVSIGRIGKTREGHTHNSYVREYNTGVDAFNRGLGYYEKKDFKKAVEWYRKSAEQGNAKAQHNLGVCYNNGEGVEQDKEEAVKWYRKAAEQGNADAQLNLGIMYFIGDGVKEDDAEAVKWYRKAAEQGNAKAQAELGMMYEHGWGVAEDGSEAMRWYRKAAEQGDDDAKEALKGWQGGQNPLPH